MSKYGQTFEELAASFRRLGKLGVGVAELAQPLAGKDAPLLPLDCALCGQPISAEQFPRAVLERVESLTGWRLPGGPCHAECMPGYQPRHINGPVQPPPRKP